MKISYERSAAHSSMVIRGADFPFAEYELSMVLHNQPSCLLPMQMLIADGKTEYWYEISGMQSLEVRLAGRMAAKDLIKKLCYGLCDLLIELEEYLLCADDISFLAETIYLSKDDERVLFCFVPGLKSRQQNGLAGLFDVLRGNIDTSDPCLVKTVAKLYEKCAAQVLVTSDLLDAFIPEKSANACSSVSVNEDGLMYLDIDDEWLKQQILDGENAGKPARRKHRGHVRKEKKQRSGTQTRFCLKRKKKEPFDEDFWADVPLMKTPAKAEAGLPEDTFTRTVYLGAASPAGGLKLRYLGRAGLPDLIIDKSPYRIGTYAKYNDGVLNAAGISRMHASIELIDGVYYLEDINSLNGTCVNGELQSFHTPVPIRSGDRVAFGAQEFAAEQI